MFLYMYCNNLSQNLHLYNTWCDNLIPGMALWKQKLLTCALMAAVAFKILYFRDKTQS
jgi:hypothetical protein